MSRITESELILPALYLMNEDPLRYVDTSTLIKELTEIMRPTGEDAQILTGRKDTHFSQIVRNLKSHNTLEKKGYATYTKEKGFRITSAGRELATTEKDPIRYLISSSFRYDDVVEALGKLTTNPDIKKEPYEEIVTEGGAYTQTVKYTERSHRLRDVAIEYFTQNGRIVCGCCGFDFSCYTPKYACNCIEIHHIKPLFQYADADESKTIEEALKNLLPVCPNCHRVIHRHNIDAQGLDEFKSYCMQKKMSLG